jgi:guanylate kinase
MFVQAIEKGTLFIISGPSGVGKGTVITGLLAKQSNIRLAVSACTRLPRESEVDGADYHFIDDVEFERKVSEDAFLEWCEVHGNRYGTLKNEVDTHVNEGQNVLLEIDTKGAQKVKKRRPEVIQIFIAPPSLETLRSRLIGRNTENSDIIDGRMKTAEAELASMDRYDYVVINNEIDETVDETLRIMNREATQ